MQSAESYTFPNKMGRLLMLALEEVLGANSMNAVLTSARLPEYIGNYPPNNFERGFSFDELSAVLQAVEEMYGSQGGRSLARRAGHICVRMGISDFGPVLGLADLAFKVVPLNVKLKAAFEVLAQTFNRFTDVRVRLEEDTDHYHWLVDQCGACWGRHSDAPCCDLVVGILEEGLFWVSGGKRFYVEEVACRAAGQDWCKILIGRNPL
jgi:predicted hydrocarbon binding protein